jgi:putative transposase
MAIKRPKPEEIVVKLRQVEVLMGQGMPRIDAIRQISVTEQTYYRWKKKRDLDRHWSEDNGRVRNGHRTTQGTEAASERERAPSACGF